jgi:peptidoglycan/xylan/chitin deacetylase (PgdA/CDA1 family)
MTDGMSSSLRILTYHRIDDVPAEPRLNPRLISATPAVFDEHVRFLAETQNVVSLEEVVNSMQNGKRLPRRAVLITFDDAYRDFQDVAWPILKKHGAPATVFVPTGYPDEPERTFWWDRLYRNFAYTDRTELPETPLGRLSMRTPEERDQNLRQLQAHIKITPHEEAMGLVEELCEYLGVDDPPAATVLGWDELRKLSKDGVTIGAHTIWHPLLTRVSRERVREEVVESQRTVASEIGEVLPVFSYPNGAHDDTVVDVLREEGFAVAVTQMSGHVDLRKIDPLRLRRINITRRNTLRVLRLRLQPWFAAIDRWRQRGG